MKKLVWIAMFVGCGLFAVAQGTTSSHAAAPAAESSQAAGTEDEACEVAATGADSAASCSTGGWHATGTCCFTSGMALERWTLGSKTKCCGPCFLP